MYAATLIFTPREAVMTMTELLRKVWLPGTLHLCLRNTLAVTFGYKFAQAVTWREKPSQVLTGYPTKDLTVAALSPPRAQPPCILLVPSWPRVSDRAPLPASATSVPPTAVRACFPLLCAPVFPVYGWGCMCFPFLWQT